MKEYARIAKEEAKSRKADMEEARKLVPDSLPELSATEPINASEASVTESAEPPVPEEMKI